MAHYHLIGIGGTGLSAIARVLHERGERVSGSDIANSNNIQELSKLGMEIRVGHNGNNIKFPDIVIRSSAINDSNPEVIAAVKKNIPVLKRRDFLEQLTKKQKVIAISGTHGKTTTTAMAAWSLEVSGLEPTYVIGSKSKNLGNNAAAGRGDYFVIEADEYDNMFLGLSPEILVITNIEHDHPDCFPTEQEYLYAFIQLTKNIVPGGFLIACSDSPGVRNLLQDIPDSIKVITYGTNNAADLQIVSSEYKNNTGIQFVIQKNTNQKNLPEKIEISMGLPGIHNALNATAVIILSSLINANLENTEKALSSFSGTGRRFDIIGQANGIIFIDDYGHHPTEIKTTLAAARNQYPRRKIWAIWQPHTYSRTQELFDEFIDSFSNCDHVIVTEIFKSREAKQNYSSQLLVDTLDHPDKKFIATLQETEEHLIKSLSPGDILIVFSAGDANQITRNIFEWYQNEGMKND